MSTFIPPSSAKRLNEPLSARASWAERCRYLFAVPATGKLVTNLVIGGVGVLGSNSRNRHSGHVIGQPAGKISSFGGCHRTPRLDLTCRHVLNRIGGNRPSIHEHETTEPV